MNDRLAVGLQYLLPKQALTAFAGLVARWRGGAMTTTIIRWFVGRYGVDLSEAEHSNPEHYATFNAFFTRALAPGVRPLAVAALVCPVDGAISQFGALTGERIFQAKGHDYSATALLGGDAALAARFHGGQFATLYLSPRDYHRIHMPCAGRLLRMVHVPGALFSVNPVTARGVPGLFARNERVVCCFEDARTDHALVMVGALNVGSMDTVWHGEVAPRSQRVVTALQPRGPGASLSLPRGAEMGRFNMGSTVVLLFPPGRIEWQPDFVAGRRVRMGEPIGRLLADGR